jgi:hypothetical protein
MVLDANNKEIKLDDYVELYHNFRSRRVYKVVYISDNNSVATCRMVYPKDNGYAVTYLGDELLLVSERELFRRILENDL